MRKYKLFLDYAKEERWLAEMARKGWRLVSAGYCGYRFVRREPAAVVYRMDYRSFKSRGDYEDYLALFEDAGWAHVAGTRRSGSQYFARRAGSEAEEGEDIFSDGASRAGRYRRTAEVWSALAITLMACFVVFGMTGLLDFETLLHPRDWYYTPGLWERTGWDFWGAFLFETPFAVWRGLSSPASLLGLVVCCVMWLRVWRLGSKSRREG